MPSRFKENHVQILTTSLKSLALPGFSLKREEWGKREREKEGRWSRISQLVSE